jgi:transcriptional regulator with XRE-family HTH domain
MNFNERLNIWIKENGIKQSDIATIAQVSKGYINHVVSGRQSPSNNFIEALMKMSGKSKYWWVNGKDENDNLNSFNNLLNALIVSGDIKKDGTYDKDIELIIKTMIDREIKLKLEKLR